MKLLIVTQAVDRANPVLGFFHEWIDALAGCFEQVEVICLSAGDYALPTNVRVNSLGKELQAGKGEPARRMLMRVRYAVRFFRFAWQLRSRYDAVLVHMNQEYVLMAGWFWRLLGKPIYMWRNHYAGSWLTGVAAIFCTKVFCTSRHSYTARYRKTALMPVGVDSARFFPDARVPRKERSILFLARMAPSKDPLMLLEALRELSEQQVPFTATFVGSPLPEHEAYYRSLVGRAESYGLMEKVTFLPGVPKDEAPDLYRSHAIFVNCSPSGMFDKTLFEAAASGCLVLARSADWAEAAGETFTFDTAESLAERLRAWLEAGTVAQESATAPLHAMVRRHDLDTLAKKLSAILHE